MSSPWGRSSTAATRHAYLLDQGEAPLRACGSLLPFLWGQGHSRGLGASLETTRAREGESPGAGSMGLPRPSHTQEGDLYSLAPVQPSTKIHPFPSIVVCFFPLTARNGPAFCGGFLKAPLSNYKSKLFGLAARCLTIQACLALPGRPLPAHPHTPLCWPVSAPAGLCTTPILPSPVVSELQVVLGSYQGMGATDAAQASQIMPPTHSIPTMASLPHRPTNWTWHYY